MLTFRDLEALRGKLTNAVVTIGNFDGVHLGHREIFRRVTAEASQIKGVSVVLTFDPHPLKIFPTVKSLKLITPYEEKESLIEASGIDYLITIPFTPEFAAFTATEFVVRILVESIGMKKLIIGYDYAFGRDREGNVSLLQALGAEHGFDVDVLPPIGDGDTIYSSTRVREMIGKGDVKGVVSLLGRHFSIVGSVIHGHHRGKQLGFPTANLMTGNELIPKSGVYAVKVKIDEKIFDGACSIGSNPTFGETTTTIEVFIFELDQDLYGCRIRLFFIERIRDERKFIGSQALQEAIQSDVIRCRKILSATSIIEYQETPLVKNR